MHQKGKVTEGSLLFLFLALVATALYLRVGLAVLAQGKPQAP